MPIRVDKKAEGSSAQLSSPHGWKQI